MKGEQVGHGVWDDVCQEDTDWVSARSPHCRHRPGVTDGSVLTEIPDDSRGGSEERGGTTVRTRPGVDGTTEVVYVDANFLRESRNPLKCPCGLKGTRTWGLSRGVRNGTRGERYWNPTFFNQLVHTGQGSW